MVMIVLSYGANNYIINVHVKLWFTLLGYTPSVEDISNVMKCDRKFYSDIIAQTTIKVRSLNIMI